MWGIGLRWLRDGKVVEDYHILHGSEETDEYRLSPIRATIERGTPLQRRLDRPVLGSRAQGVFGRASPAHDRPAKGSHATPPLPLRRVAQNSAQRRLVCRVTEARPPAEGNSRSCSSTVSAVPVLVSDTVTKPQMSMSVFRFARDSPLEGAGFEPSVPRPDTAVLDAANAP
jgi:hypothetical protein